MAIARLNSAAEWVTRFGEGRKQAVVTIGNFDGIHRGHQEILRKVREEARQEDQLAAVLTLFPHPLKVLRPTEAPALMMTIDQRLAAFDAAGIDAVLVFPFDLELSKMGPEDFARRYLAETMRASKVLVGENFRFGHRQEGDVRALESYGRQWGFEVEIVKSLAINGAVASSTAIREALRDGRVEDAERMLGHPFALEGEVQTGTGQGRKLVVPTLNLSTDQEMLPKKGVYATETLVGGKAYRSVTNVGVRPTFDGSRITVETHLFDFSETWTSGKMEVRFLRRLRDERKFTGAEELRTQVLKDIEVARDFHRQQP
jgi:riboflavin kinase / FMN adenylyltransferase